MKHPLRLRKIFSFGDIYNQPLYSRLQELDKKVFADAKSEFKPNREWWVIVDKGLIVAYCGAYTLTGYVSLSGLGFTVRTGETGCSPG